MNVYGIKNCDTVKKALAFLDAHKIAYTFHDFKREGVTKKQIDTWLEQVGWEELLNTRGMTWRKLPDAQKENINETKAIRLMIENPSIIKRPVVVTDKQLILGFDAKVYKELS
jgi:arsenate reductase